MTMSFNHHVEFGGVIAVDDGRRCTCRLQQNGQEMVPRSQLCGIECTRRETVTELLDFDVEEAQPLQSHPACSENIDRHAMT